MSRIVNLAEIPTGYSNGELLPSLVGRITKLYQRKTGEGQYGPWSVQGGKIEGNGATIDISFFDLPDQGNLTGKEVVISCTQGDKGPIGVSVDDNEYKGKTTRRIKVQKQADIAFATGAPQAHAPAQNAPSHPPQNAAPPQQPHSQPTSQRPPPGSDHDINEVKKAIVQNGNLRLLVGVYMETVFAPAFKAKTGKDLDEARKGGWVTSIAIAVENKGMASLMPTHPLFVPPAANAAPPQQPPPQEPEHPRQSW